MSKINNPLNIPFSSETLFLEEAKKLSPSPEEDLTSLFGIPVSGIKRDMRLLTSGEVLQSCPAILDLFYEVTKNCRGSDAESIVLAILKSLT